MKWRAAFLTFVMLLVLVLPAQAVVSSTSLRDDFTASAGNTDFNFDFPIFTKNNIKVIVNGVVKTLDSDYTVRSGTLPFESVTTASLPSTGFIRFIVALSGGEIVSLLPTQPITQLSTYTVEPFPAKRIETDYDKEIMVSRMLQEQVRRTPGLKQESLFKNLTIDDPVASKFLRWKEDLTGLENADPGGGGAVAFPITIGQGGTGATTAAQALINLGIGTVITGSGGKGYTNFWTDTQTQGASSKRIFVAAFGTAASNVQEAIDAAPAGGHVIMDCISYSGTAALSITKKITLTGCGKFSTILNNGTGMGIDINTTDGVTLRDFQISGTIGSGVGIRVAGLENVSSYFSNLRIANQQVGINCDTCNTFWLVNSEIQGIQGVKAAPSGYGLVLNNTVNHDHGDFTIQNVNVNIPTAGAVAILSRVNGVRYINVKCIANGASACIEFDGTSSPTGQQQLLGGSLEGTHDYGVIIGGANLFDIMINGTEIIGDVSPILLKSTLSASAGFTIINNWITSSSGAGPVIDIQGGGFGTIDGNVITGTGGSSVGINVASGAGSTGNMILIGPANVYTTLGGAPITSASSKVLIAGQTGGGNAGAFTFATIPASFADGSSFYCSDCLIATTCAGSSTGAWLQRLGGADYCGAAGGGSGAPTTAQYLVVALDATLSAERVLTAGTGISFTDAGANSTFTVAVNQATNYAWTGNQTWNQQAAITLLPFNTGAGQTSEIHFKELAANGTEYVGFKAPDSIAGNITWTLPATDGTNGYALVTNGSGILSWASIGGGGGSGITSLNGLTAGTQTFANDTNVTISSITSTHTLGWTGTLAVARGGSGAGTFTNNGVLYGKTTSPFGVTAAGTSGQIFAGVTGSPPVWTFDPSALTFTSQGQYGLRLGPYGAASGNTGAIAFYELTANGTNVVGFKAPNSIAADAIWTLPAADGTFGGILTTDGAKVLSWSNALNVSYVNVSTGLYYGGTPGLTQVITLCGGSITVVGGIVMSTTC